MKRAGPRESSLGQPAGEEDATPPANAARRLAAAKIVWLASVRRGGRPHLVPVWFAWVDEGIFLCISPTSAKGRNLEAEPRVVVALEDGTKPLICEGVAEVVEAPWPKSVIEAFERRYAWRIDREQEYTRLLRIQPVRWLTW